MPLSNDCCLSKRKGAPPVYGIRNKINRAVTKPVARKESIATVVTVLGRRRSGLTREPANESRSNSRNPRRPHSKTNGFRILIPHQKGTADGQHNPRNFPCVFAYGWLIV